MFLIKVLVREVLFFFCATYQVVSCVTYKVGLLQIQKYLYLEWHAS